MGTGWCRALVSAAGLVLVAGCTINLGVPSGALPDPVEPAQATQSVPDVLPSPSATAPYEPPAQPSSDPPPSNTQPRTSDPAPEPAPTQEARKRVRLSTIDTSPDPTLPWIRQGNRSDGARCVQHALNVIRDARIPVDGYYGPVSRRALQSFQRSIAILDDGEVGPATGHWLATYYDYAQGTGAWARSGCYGFVPARRG